MKFSSLSLLALALLPFPAFAQEPDNQAVMDRLDHVEHDLQLLQKQVSRGEPVSTPSGDADVPVGGSAALEVRLSAMEDEIRQLRGQVEQDQNQVQKLSANLDKLQKDTDFRFNDLASKAAPPAAPEAASGKPVTPLAAAKPKEKPPAALPAPEGPTTAGNGVLEPPKEDANSLATPRELYNYGFRLLNQTQYEEAASTFDAFTKKYPKDPLVGNAYYWEGETYYIRRDYVNAADNFRQGFESLPDGPKAADNLLKLAMSLDALNRDKEACVVLKQIVTKFKKSSTTVTDKADQEQKRIGCASQ